MTDELQQAQEAGEIQEEEATEAEAPAETTTDEIGEGPAADAVQEESAEPDQGEKDSESAEPEGL